MSVINTRFQTALICAGAILVILALAAFTLPILFSGRMCALAESGVEDVRVLTVALISYDLEYHSYPASLDALGPPGPGSSVGAPHNGWIDTQLASGNKVGYLFRYTPRRSPGLTAVTGYTLTADPIGRGPGHHYFSDETGVLRAEPDRPATANSPETHDSSCTCAAKEDYVGPRI